MSNSLILTQLTDEDTILELNDTQLAQVNGGFVMITMATIAATPWLYKLLTLSISKGIPGAIKLGQHLGKSQWFVPRGIKIGNFTLIQPAVVSI